MEAGDSYSGMYFTLTEDIDNIETMVGSEGKPFSGHFYGNGKELKVSSMRTTSNQSRMPSGRKKLASMVYRCSSLFASMRAKVLFFYEICIVCALYSAVVTG